MNMSKDEINMLLDIQQKAYKDSVELLFSSLSKRIEDQNKLIFDLKYSLEFTQEETRTLKTDLDKLKKESDEQKKIISCQQEAIDVLNKKQDLQEDYSRRKNIRIDGMMDDIKENREQTQFKVQKLLREKLGLDQMNIDVAHRLSKKSPTSNTPRTIIAKLSNGTDRDEVMKRTNKLKGCGIFINEDYSETTARIRRELQPQMRAARDSGKLAYLKGRQLIIRDRSKRQIEPIPQASSSHTHTRRVSSLVEHFTPDPQAVSLDLVPPSPILQKKNNDAPPNNDDQLDVTERRRSQRRK